MDFVRLTERVDNRPIRRWLLEQECPHFSRRDVFFYLSRRNIFLWFAVRILFFDLFQEDLPEYARGEGNLHVVLSPIDIEMLRGNKTFAARKRRRGEEVQKPFRLIRFTYNTEWHERSPSWVSRFCLSALYIKSVRITS